MEFSIEGVLVDEDSLKDIKAYLLLNGSLPHCLLDLLLNEDKPQRGQN